MQTITINGMPIAQARPRFVKRGKFAHAYNPQETEAGKWILQAKDQVTECMEGPLLVSIYCFFQRPKSHFGTGKNSGTLKPSAPKYCLNSKDVDNLAKFILDCLNGLAYKDDKQIIDLRVRKRWGLTASTLVCIDEIK